MIAPTACNDFPWEACATLLAGGAAVFGAVFVGVKQAGIASRQAEILQQQAEIAGRQVDLYRLELRAQLFDRRMNVYDTARQYLGEVMRHGAPPSTETENLFARTLADAEMLFGEQVMTELRGLWHNVLDFSAAHRVRCANEARGDDVDDEYEREHRLFECVTNRLQTMRIAFLSEASLTAAA